MKAALSFVAILFLIVAHAQTGTVKGGVQDEAGLPIPAVNILLASDSTIGTISDLDGQFEIAVPPGSNQLIFSHIQHRTRVVDVNPQTGTIQNLQVVLNSGSIELQEVEIEGDRERDEIVSATSIDTRSSRNLPSATGDFSKVLVTLPGVASNNELSTAYNVRGGNFDENLVYVNDIPIYRPFLANAGRQEGLSFVNPDLISNIDFYPGGWEAKYGDKLSSSLNIQYKEPENLEGSINVGLLGGSAYLGNSVDKIKYSFAARHSDTRYLLNTLETQGQYLPSYTDVQSMLTFDLSGRTQNINRTKLNWLFGYSRNRYLTLPESQTTEFGSVSQTLRIQTAFQGQELLNYDTYQSGFNLSHRWNNYFLSRWIASGVYTREKEFFNVEGAYRICDVNNNPASSDFNECAIIRGIGTNFDYGRNSLEAQLYTVEWRNEYLMNDWVLLEGGVGFQYNNIVDELNEYSFLDSAGFIDLNSSVFNTLDLNTVTTTGYFQSSIFSQDSTHGFNIGVRLNHLDYTDELIMSPRFVYRLKPNWSKETIFRLSVGKYAQPPLYRELRGFDGNIRTEIKAQQSWHFIAGMERILSWWNRPFLFTVDGYYKSLFNVTPFDIDNVRLRYYANNDAEAYAYGLDFRLNGEFIKGTQSWFSLGWLSTKEDITEDDKGFIRRPTDQNINLAFYFEDHLPGDPTVRVYVNSVFGSGFPLGPPNEINARNIFSGDEYYRLDVGFSKSFELRNHKYLKIFWLRAEILNALGADNTLSYSWIQDINGSQLAIPNSLSARFLNLRIAAEF